MAALAACGDGDSEPPLALAQRVLGGAEALADAELLRYRSSGTETVADEGATPGVPRASGSFTLRGDIDLRGDGLRLAYARTSTAIVPGMVNTFDEIVTNRGGYILGNELILGAAPDYVGADMSPARVGAVRRQQVLLSPHLLVRDLREAQVVELAEETLGGRPHRVLRVPAPTGDFDVDLLIDATQLRLDRVRSREVDHLRGDVEVTVDFADWRPGDGGTSALVVPRRLTLARDGVVLHDETRSEVVVGPPSPDDLFALPAQARPVEDAELASWGTAHSQFHHQFARLGTAPFFDWPSLQVRGDELAPGSGVYHLTGGGHHSLLVDQGDHVVLIEAPLYEARSEAILAWIDQHLAGGLAANPVSHVVATHHHADHSGGLRRFVAAGATIVVGADAEALFKEVFAAPWTLLPDALSKSTGAVKLEAVAAGGRWTMGTVTAYAVTSAHASDMLMVHVAGVGAAGALFNSDLYLPDQVGILPGSIFAVGGVELDAALVEQGLADDAMIMVGGHGNVDNATGQWFAVDYATFHQQVLAIGS